MSNIFKIEPWPQCFLHSKERFFRDTLYIKILLLQLYHIVLSPSLKGVLEKIKLILKSHAIFEGSFRLKSDEKTHFNGLSSQLAKN